MGAGARTPEELETLLEDAFVVHDLQALAQLFQPGAMLVTDRLPEARGRRQITQVAAQLWDSKRRYLADPDGSSRFATPPWSWQAAPPTWSGAATTGRGATRSRRSTFEKATGHHRHLQQHHDRAHHGLDSSGLECPIHRPSRTGAQSAKQGAGP